MGAIVDLVWCTWACVSVHETVQETCRESRVRSKERFPTQTKEDLGQTHIEPDGISEQETTLHSGQHPAEPSPASLTIFGCRDVSFLISTINLTSARSYG